RRDPAERLLHLLSGDLPLGREPLQGAADRLASALHGRVVEVVQPHRPSRLRRDLGDARAHQSRPDDHERARHAASSPVRLPVVAPYRTPVRGRHAAEGVPGRPSAGGPPVRPPDAPPTTVELPPDERCTDEIRANPRRVCLTSARFEDGELVIGYEAAWADGVPDVNGGYHLHLYGGDGTDPPADLMG